MVATSVSDCVDAVFILVVFLRLVVPLWIPRFPFPTILAALVIDAADQTFLAAFDAEPRNYQSYDKALDMYYLAVAYAATIRNWTDSAAFRVGRFLWYFRLVGVALFEVTGARFLLLLFPNTFEYFFIGYEFVRLRWDPTRLKPRVVLWFAAVIWLGIKLPQEWWIHVAQLDVTSVLSQNVWAWPVLAVLALSGWLGYTRWGDRLPEPDWSVNFDVDAHRTTTTQVAADNLAGWWSPLRHPLIEKAVFIGLMAVILAQLAPESSANAFEIGLGVAIIVVSSTLLGSWITRGGVRWQHAVIDFAVTGVANLIAILGLRLLPTPGEDGAGFGLTIFLATLLSLMVALYDRYRALRLVSIVEHPSPGRS